jgi:hypothetical protein
MITTKSSFPPKTKNKTHRSRKHKLHTTPKTEFIIFSLSLSLSTLPADRKANKQHRSPSQAEKSAQKRATKEQLLSEIQDPELLVIIFLSETDQQKTTPIMKFGNRRRGIYSEEEKAQQRPR